MCPSASGDFLQRYECGYLLKGVSSAAAAKLWARHQHKPSQRIIPKSRPDLLAIELGPTRLDGIEHCHDSEGRERRTRRHVDVSRVVVYHEDPDQVPPKAKPGCFLLLTTVEQEAHWPEQLLNLYNQRGGDVENVLSQLDQAFQITHMRNRRFHGNYVFLMLTLIAATLTQLVRQEAISQELPMPAGLKETLEAARESGLYLNHTPDAGCSLVRSMDNCYTPSFLQALRGSHQLCFRYAA